MNPLTLKIVTPEGVDRSIPCDSVILWMAADTRGRKEGSIGIQKGHVNCVIALGNGPVQARSGGAAAFSGETKGGFATVMDDTITVITPHIEMNG